MSALAVADVRVESAALSFAGSEIAVSDVLSFGRLEIAVSAALSVGY